MDALVAQTMEREARIIAPAKDLGLLDLVIRLESGAQQGYRSLEESNPELQNIHVTLDVNRVTGGISSAMICSYGSLYKHSEAEQIAQLHKQKTVGLEGWRTNRNE